MIAENDATLLGPPAARGLAPSLSKNTEPGNPTSSPVQTETLEPSGSANSLTPTPSETSTDPYTFFRVNNCGITGNTGGTSNFRRSNGQFAPGHPYRFRPGQSANPKGRPRKPKAGPVSDALHQELAKPVPKAPHINFSELIARLMLSAALSGDIRAIREVLDRTSGRPRLASREPHRIDDLEQWPLFRQAILNAVEPHPRAKASIQKGISAIESVNLDDD